MKVVVHSADWCSPCVELKKQLEKEGIEFTVIDWTVKMFHPDRPPVLPLTIINETKITGYNIDAIKEALQK